MGVARPWPRLETPVTRLAWSRSEKLVELGVAPLRRRTRKPKPPEEKKP